MAMSRKNVEKPVVRNLPQLGSGISEADGPQRAAPGEKGWDSITVKVMPEPIAVASPAMRPYVW